MRIEILAIGDELLDGRVTDTNTLRLAHALGAIGLHLSHRSSVTDDIDDIVREARHVAARGTELCIVSGGLGPTTDDLTAQAFARLCDVPLVRDAAAVAHLTALLQSRGRQINASQLRQADRPKCATLVQNDVGTAPGFALNYQGCKFICMPGVPAEFDAMLQATVIAPHTGKAPIARRALYCFGLAEAEVDRRLADWPNKFPRVRLQFRVKFPEVHVTMHAAPADIPALDDACAFARQQLGEHVFSDHDGKTGLPETVLASCLEHNVTLSLAESCTGGLVCDLLTDVSGSSAVFLGGVVAYDNAIKVGFLGVEEGTLKAHGAVSEEVVLQMAAGARARLHTTYGLSVSGVAGPSGGSDKKPVGTTWLGLAGPRGNTARKLVFPFGRRANKQAAAYAVLNLLRRDLSGSESQPT